MKLSSKGLEVIKRYETFVACPYLDAANIPTIGYGNTFYEDGTKVTMNDNEISERSASVLLNNIVVQFEVAVNKLVKRTLTQNQFDALVIFTYNVGAYALKQSTLLKRVNEDPKHATIPNEFTKWTKSAGRRLRGLAKRRTEEAFIYYIGYTL